MTTGLTTGLTTGYKRKSGRSQASKYNKKLATAEAEWAKRAEEIQAGERQNLFDVFEERGFIKDLAGYVGLFLSGFHGKAHVLTLTGSSRDTIREMMRTKRIGAYVGIDPTASSLHVGHLVPFMPLFWMYMHGYRAFSLVGGSTAKIGDPTDRLKSRETITPADMTMNMTKIHFQLKKLWENVDRMAQRQGYERNWAWKRGVLNNNHWWNKQPLLEILRMVGQSIRIGPMLSRDT